MLIPYRYIDPKLREIRLLKLLPALHEDSPLQCCMIHARLATVKYEAVSYVWGDPKERKPLEIVYDTPNSAGQEVGSFTKTTIGANLESALRHIRRRDSENILWVDAICINQHDDAEKSSQVRLMGLIYQEAAKVLVWLGPASESSDATMDIFRSIGAEAGRILPDETTKDCNDQEFFFSKFTSANLWQDTKPSDKQDQAMKSLLDKVSGRSRSTGVGIFPPHGVKDVLERTWWTRVWVLQEFLMAKAATFICGHKRVQETDFTRAVDIYFGYSNHLIARDITRDPSATTYMKLLVKTRPGDQALYILSMRRSTQNQAPTLMSMMGTLYDRNNYLVDATDPRDRVFAILGIVEHDLGLLPNYSLSCAEVYIEVTSAILHSGQIELLSYCRPHLNNLRLPSWVVDWTSEVGHYLDPLERELSGLSSSVYPEHRDKEHGQISIQLAPEPVLSLRGTIVDRILYVSMSWEEHSTTCFEDSNILAARLESCVPAGASLSSYVAEIITRHVICRRWLLILQEMTSSSRLYGSIDTNETLLDILCCGDKGVTGMETGHCPATLLEAMKLLATSENYMAWLGDLRDHGHLNQLIGMIEAKAQNMRACASVQEYTGYVPEPVQNADIVVFFAGAEVPFLVRPGKGERYKLLGPAYIQGMMQGEYTRETNDETTFNIA